MTHAIAPRFRVGVTRIHTASASRGETRNTRPVAALAVMLALLATPFTPAPAAETTLNAPDRSVVIDGPGTYQLPFVIERSGDLADGVRLQVETAEGGPNPATPGQDYTPVLPGTELVLDPGQASATMNVDVFGDDLVAGNEYSLLFRLTRANSFNAVPRLAPTSLHSRVCCLTRSMVVADLNDDGHPDVVAGNDFSFDLTALLNNGEGRFDITWNHPIDDWSLGSFEVAAGDVTGDGHADIVAAGFRATDILVFAGDGAGDFTQSLTLSTGDGEYPTEVEIIDVNDDDHPDIVTVNGDTANVSVLLGDGAGGFADPTNFPTGGAFPNRMALGELTGDEHLDIVTANMESADISILAGDGAGNFDVQKRLTVGADAAPLTVVVADATGDGIADIVTANRFDDGSPFPPADATGSASVLAGDGAGGFAAPLQLSPGTGPGRVQSVAVADVTADGHPDIALTQTNNNTASLLAGDGAGGFADAVIHPTGIGPNPVRIADVTGDGQPDVLTANGTGESISVLPGNGTGNIGFEGSFDVGQYPHSVVVDDLTGDDHPDVATANIQSNNVSLLAGDGAGGFSPGVTYPTGPSPIWIISGDVNEDDIPDLVTANLGGANVSVLAGDGAGGYAAPENFPVNAGTQNPRAVDIGDFNGDGHPDLVTVNELPFGPLSSSDTDPVVSIGRAGNDFPADGGNGTAGDTQNNTVSVLLGDGNGDFAEATVFDLGAETSGANSLMAADVTADGHPDIVVANLSSGNLSLLEGDGTGGFSGPTHITTAPGSAILAFSDVTADGHPDLISMDHTSQSVSVLAGDGSGGYTEAVHFPIFVPDGPPCTMNPGPCPWPWDMRVADVTGDGHPDIVIASTNLDAVTVMINDGAGDFSDTRDFQTGTAPGAVGVADVTGDGNPDVISANRENDNVSVLTNLLSRAVLADDEAVGTLIASDGAPVPVIAVTPASVDFGDQPVDTTSVPQSITVENIGTGDLNIQGIDSPVAPFARAGGSCDAAPFTLAAGETCTVDYSFGPAAEGGHQTTVTITSNDDPVDIALSGTGTSGGGSQPAAAITLGVDFGAIPVGESAGGEVSLENTGDATLDVYQVTAPDAPFSLAADEGGPTACPEAPFSLEPDATCTWTVTFEPTQPGAFADQLLVASNAASSPHGATLTGNGGNGSPPGDSAFPVPALDRASAGLLILLMLAAAGWVGRHRARRS